MLESARGGYLSPSGSLDGAINWQQVIESEIEKCDYFLAFLSRRSVSKTGYVNRELRYALEQGERRPFGQRFIVPILLDDCVLPREFREIHSLRMWERGSYEKRVQALSERNLGVE